MRPTKPSNGETTFFWADGTVDRHDVDYRSRNYRRVRLLGVEPLAFSREPDPLDGYYEAHDFELRVWGYGSLYPDECHVVYIEGDPQRVWDGARAAESLGKLLGGLAKG